MSEEKKEIEEEIVSEPVVKEEKSKKTKKIKVPKEPKPIKKHGSIVRYAVMGGIIILSNLFVIYALNIAYPEPQYSNYCKVEQTKPMLSNEADCLSVGGQWNSSVGVSEGEVTNYCNQDFTCSQDYDKANSLYQRNVFIVFVVIGIALLVGSVFLSGSSLIASSLSFAGVLAFVIGSLGYWSNMDDILRVIILGASLIVLLYLAWKKFED